MARKRTTKEADILYEEIAARIQRQRIDRNIHQETLAKAVGLSRTSITNFESGRQKVPLLTLYKIAQILKIKLYDLLPEELSSIETPLLPSDLTDKEKSWIESGLKA